MFEWINSTRSAFAFHQLVDCIVGQSRGCRRFLFPRAPLRHTAWRASILPPPTRSKIMLGPYKEVWVIDNGGKPLIKCFRGKRLGQKLIHPGITGFDQPAIFRIVGQHNARLIRVRAVFGGPYQPHEVQPIERLYMPVDDNHISVKMLQLLESLRGVSRLATLIAAPGACRIDRLAGAYACCRPGRGRYRLPIHSAN